MAAVTARRILSLEQRACALLRRRRWISSANVFRRCCFCVDVGSTAKVSVSFVFISTN